MSLPFLQQFVDSVVALTSDVGIEMAFTNLMIKDILDVMPSWDVDTLNPDDNVCSCETNYFMNSAMLVCGLLHILPIAAKDLHQCMEYFTDFQDKSSVGLGD